MSGLKIHVAILGFCWAVSSWANANPVEASIAKDIEAAQTHLEQTQIRIGKERVALAGELNALEQKVLGLREQTAVARRLTDERTLSLQQMQQRLSQWREQQAYQQNLLARFLRQHDQSLANANDPLQATLTLSKQIQEKLQPGWRNQDMVLADGSVHPTATLTLGPSIWFWQADEQKGGLAFWQNGLLREGLVFSGAHQRALQSLFHDGQGLLAIDPSLTQASQSTAQNETAFEHISKGGLWAIPIVFFALFAVTIAIIKAVQLWRLPAVRAFSNEQLQSLAQHSGDGRLSMQRNLAHIAATVPIGQTRDDQLFVALQDAKNRLDRWLGAIAVTASVAPLLGLLGTVSGMIETFKMMTLFGAGDPQVVSGGISQALVTTELGLVVAIPALILNAVLSRRAKHYYSQLESFALQLSQFDSSPKPDYEPRRISRQQEEAVA